MIWDWSTFWIGIAIGFLCGVVVLGFVLAASPLKNIGGKITW